MPQIFPMNWFLISLMMMMMIIFIMIMTFFLKKTYKKLNMNSYNMTVKMITFKW
uniref:ATP synthase subunit 8 n=1 Tax=Haemaphysalis formosensis TaxID=1155004 RepID=L7PCD1_HAEFO|nr:ATP synthase subunit 8 [Haemaphysalis formosensis]AFU55280.1 ATP synthase subunit 8 [Haemaphysalis formosensis]UXX50201.1 ATP synthase subunit 8 [Haemaphysalis formosensis]